MKSRRQNAGINYFDFGSSGGAHDARHYLLHLQPWGEDPGGRTAPPFQPLRKNMLARESRDLVLACLIFCSATISIVTSHGFVECACKRVTMLLPNSSQEIAMNTFLAAGCWGLGNGRQSNGQANVVQCSHDSCLILLLLFLDEREDSVRPLLLVTLRHSPEEPAS